MASAGTPDFVAGAVVVWGRVEVHATGMRAEHARIVGLEQPLTSGGKRRELDTVAEHLGVPVVPHSRMAAVAMAHGLPLDPCLRPATSGSADSLDLLRPGGIRPEGTGEPRTGGRVGRDRRRVAEVADRPGYLSTRGSESP
jgi:hypothetical protein